MQAEQRKRIWPILFIILQIMSWVSATSRPFQNSDHAQSPHSFPDGSKSTQNFHGKKMEAAVHKEAFKGLSTLGSRPPSCDHKCGECLPCEAIQVPTTTDHKGLQYANYEPEGWKCKCGNSFFNP